MSGTVKEVQRPDWHGGDFPAAASTDWGAIATELGAFGTDAMGMVQWIVEKLGGPEDKWISGDILDPLGAFLTGISQWRESTATTMPGKFVDAAGAFGVDIGLGLIHPVVPVADAAVGFVAGLFGVENLSIAGTANAGIRGGVTAAESYFTGNERGVAEFKAKALTGEYGPILKGIFN